MKVRITKLEKTESGTYDESADLAHEMLEGWPDDEPTAESVTDWLTSEMGYEEVEGFAGWGAVLRHTETDDLLSIQIAV